MKTFASAVRDHCGNSSAEMDYTTLNSELRLPADMKDTVEAPKVDLSWLKDETPAWVGELAVAASV